MVVAFFFGATFSFASIVRLLARLHGFAAVVLSIPAAVLASFCTMVMLRLLPPRQLDGHALTVAEDMAFYGTAFIFIALNGRPVLETIASSGAEAKSDMTIGGVLFGAGIILLVWGKFVSAGLTKLVQIFLL
ncbi:hypothetical protein JH299_20690 [Xanthomonas campestris pv. incanae]|nr:hypothetical protein [Xanthomonas campestris]RFF39487.1 hypothetical protein D0A38_20755 [Xanthomonas campestris pv. incanae]WDJ09892.1 hypothetical protein JH299_20690 [Xanthomonas campestris pv. incanae]